MVERTCSIDGCERKYLARGLCGTHYRRWRLYGDPSIVHRHLPLSERLWDKVDKHGPVPDHRPDLGPCWLWLAFKMSNGYGRVGFGGGFTGLAHRATYQEMVGPIPDGLQLDHLCRNPPCVNPSHLEPVTAGENVLRSQKPTCMHGHEFTEENTYRDPKHPNARHCRACRRGAERRRRL